MLAETPILYLDRRSLKTCPRFVAGDIRFTTKGESLYAIALAWPEDGKLVIKSLASDSLITAVNSPELDSWGRNRI